MKWLNVKNQNKLSLCNWGKCNLGSLLVGYRTFHGPSLCNLCSGSTSLLYYSLTKLRDKWDNNPLPLLMALLLFAPKASSSCSLSISLVQYVFLIFLSRAFVLYFDFFCRVSSALTGVSLNIAVFLFLVSLRVSTALELSLRYGWTESRDIGKVGCLWGFLFRIIAD